MAITIFFFFKVAALFCRSAVLAESRAMLRTRAASDVAVAEALCASLLLQEISTRQALADFLLARKAAAQQLLSLTQHGNAPPLTLLNNIWKEMHH